MGDSRRFKEFADLIHKQFPRARRIADVAGGAGYLRKELLNIYDLQYIHTYDPNNKNPIATHGSREKHFRKYFTLDSLKKDQYDLIVGMHPDGASEIIVSAPIDFIIVPCCAIPTLSIYNQTIGWNTHLYQLAQKIKYKELRWLKLDITGPNKVLLCRR
jgi:hypothetical protein